MEIVFSTVLATSCSRKKDNFTHEDRLTEIQVRIYESVNRCEEFLNKEREFKRKYFNDENINIDITY